MRFRIIVLAGGACVIPALLFLVIPGRALAQTGERVEYISPLPGSWFVSPATTIAIRSSDRIQASSLNRGLFNVVGSQSETHAGSIVLADDRRTVIFKPDRAFSAGEKVQVTLASGIRTVSGQMVEPVSFGFTISPGAVANPPDESDALPVLASRAPQSRSLKAPQYVTLPADYPPITITLAPTGTAAGDIFMTPFQTGGASYAIIVDDSGQPVFYKKALGSSRIIDFQMQPNGWLTYFSSGSFLALDNTYSLTATITAGNGYTADSHELQILPNGHALILIYDTETMDMSQMVSGGDANAAVTGCLIQELDTSNNVVFQWSSWDHFLITDTYASLTTHAIDYVHCNALEEDQDGNLLLSSRHMDEITKINRSNGDVIWRWGGKNNQFAFVNDPAPYFTEQHDIRRLPNGHITLFDNGNRRSSPQYSRAAEYQLDEDTKTATLVWQFRNTPDLFGAATGDVQRLANGNTFIDWGFAGVVTELKPDDSKAFELNILPQFSYRALRFPWHGYPTTQPTLVAQTPLGRTVLTYSWNGATDISSYAIYKGNSPQPTTQLTTQAKTGFETSSNLPCDPLGTRYFRVMPIDLNGQPTQYSNDVAVGPCIQYLIPFLIK